MGLRGCEVWSFGCVSGHLQDMRADRADVYCVSVKVFGLPCQTQIIGSNSFSFVY